MTVQLVPVSNGPTVVESPAARLTVHSAAAPQLYSMAKVPENPEVSGSKTLEIFR